MNIMIYDIGDRLQNFVSQLELINDISIFFAFTKNDVKKIVQEFKPEIIFAKKYAHFDYPERNTNFNVCYLDEIGNQTALNQINLQLHKTKTGGQNV